MFTSKYLSLTITKRIVRLFLIKPFSDGMWEWKVRKGRRERDMVGEEGKGRGEGKMGRKRGES